MCPDTLPTIRTRAAWRSPSGATEERNPEQAVMYEPAS